MQKKVLHPILHNNSAACCTAEWPYCLFTMFCRPPFKERVIDYCTMQCVQLFTFHNTCRYISHVQYSEWTVGPLSSAACRPIFMQFIGCDQPIQPSYWPENRIECLGYGKGNDMRHAKKRKLCLNGPNVHSLYCGCHFRSD